MKIKVPYFDGFEVELEDEDSLSDPALIEFLNRDRNDRLKDSRHVFTYYKDFHHMVGGEDWLDEEMGVVSDPEQIWAHVAPIQIHLETGRDPDTNRYVVLYADCDWEQEHALMMVWENGKVLNKVSGYDGCLTNTNADGTRHDVVYDGGDATFTTTRDG